MENDLAEEMAEAYAKAAAKDGDFATIKQAWLVGYSTAMVEAFRYRSENESLRHELNQASVMVMTLQAKMEK